MYWVSLGGEDSRKLTGQLVAIDAQLGEARQISDGFRELCQIELFSLRYCVLVSTFQPVPNQLTGQLALNAIEHLQILEISDRFRELCHFRVFSF